MDIKAFKLITGEEIIADITDLGTYIVCSDPVQMIMGQQGLNFVPYMIYGKDKKYRFKKEHMVIEPIDVEDKLESVYREQFGSGIQVVSQGIITG